MAAYDYARVIEFGLIAVDDDGKEIVSEWVDYSDQVGKCSFTLDKVAGCKAASLAIESAGFDEMRGLKLGDRVRLSYKEDTTWWFGIIDKLTTSLTGGLAIQCKGYIDTWFGEWLVEGNFGAIVETDLPEDLAIAEDYGQGNIGAGTHRYYVITLDEVGARKPADWDIEVKLEQYVDLADEEATARRLKLTWTDEVNGNASGYRIYKAFWPDMTEVGIGTATPEASPNAYYKIDVTTTEFYDDGTLDWENLDEDEATLPEWNTARTRSCLESDVNTIVKYLIETYFLDGYNPEKITAGVGEDYVLDKFILGLTQEVTLADALQTLADYAGEVVRGIDSEGDYFFQAKASQYSDDYEEDVIQDWLLGQQYDWAAIHKDDDTIVDVLLNATKVETRDAATSLTVAGDDGYTAETMFVVLNPGPPGDPEGPPQDPDDHIDFGDFEQEEDPGGGNDPPSIRTSVKNDATSFSLGLDATAADLPTKAALDAVDGLADWFSSYDNFTAFEADYPGLGWLYRQRETIPEDTLITWITSLRDRGRKKKPASPDVVITGPRRRGPKIRIIGLRSEKSAAIVAGNIMSEYASVLGQWSVEVIKATLRYDPGLHLITVTTLSGDTYVLEIQKTTIDLSDTVLITLGCGEADIYEREEQDHNKIVRDLSRRAFMKFATPAGLNNKVVHRIKDQAEEITAGRPDAGVSAEPASIDHIHPIGLDAINKHIEKDGTVFPRMHRNFQVEGLADLDDLIDSGHGDYVRGLDFKPGDQAYVTDDGNNNGGWQYDGSDWNPLGGGIYVADVVGNLPDVNPPAFGFTTSAEHYYAKYTSTGWVALDVLEAYSP